MSFVIQNRHRLHGTYFFFARPLHIYIYTYTYVYLYIRTRPPRLRRDDDRFISYEYVSTTLSLSLLALLLFDEPMVNFTVGQVVGYRSSLPAVRRRNNNNNSSCRRVSRLPPSPSPPSPPPPYVRTYDSRILRDAHACLYGTLALSDYSHANDSIDDRGSICSASTFSRSDRSRQKTRRRDFLRISAESEKISVGAGLLFQDR